MKDDMLLDFTYLNTVYNSAPSSATPTAEQNEAQEAYNAAQAAMPPGWWLNPYGSFRTRWDLALILILCYNGYAIPLRLAFEREESIQSPVFWLDRIIDCVFLADVILNFRTGIVSATGHVDYKHVAWR